MSQITTGIRSVLSNPAMYELAQRAIGSRNVRRTFVASYVNPFADMRVLDIGCGPGDILSLLPDCDYVGFDISQAYVDAARQRYGARGRFHVAGVGDVDTSLVGDQPVDRVISKGVLHHVDDDTAAALFELAASVSTPDTVVATIDPCLHADQHPVAAWLARRDRGQAVRHPEDYAAFARQHFNDVEVVVHTDLLRLPYSHAVVRARGPVS